MKLLNIWKGLLQNQQGNVVVLVAISMFMIIGFAALAIDSGRLFLTKSNLQNGLDAAVLAGAQELLKSNNSAALNVAIDIAGKNSIKLTSSDIKIGSNYIEAKKTIEQGLSFAKIFGIDSSSIPAFARAQVGGNLLGRDGIVPIGIPKKTSTEEGFEKGQSYTLHFKPGGGKDGDSVAGNFGFIQISGNGGSDLKDNIMYGAEMEVSDVMYEWTKTGFTWGNVKAGFEYRINQDSTKPECNEYTTAHDACSRVIIVPIVESYEDASGKSLVKIIGFSAFWIESVSQHEIKGRFISTVTFGKFGSGAGTDFGVYGVRLVQ